jgi:putative transcriptional regulator
MNDYASTSLKPGILLVAHPTMLDPNFRRTVILLLAYDKEEGAMGVVLNRPLTVETINSDSPIFRWMEDATSPATIFYGGPVEPNGYICLTSDASSLSGVRSIDIEATSSVHIDTPHRLFRGYSGWSSQQLENEIVQQGWYVVESEPQDAMTSNPETLWNRVMSRQEGALHRLGQFPNDLSSN